MNRFIIVFFLIILTSRLFSETLKVLPKAVDLLDLVIVPVLFVVALTYGRPKGVDKGLHDRMTRLSVAFMVLAVLSAVVNIDRTYAGPTMLYTFALLEGPFLFLALNLLIRDKAKFGEQLAGFFGFMVMVEIAAVVFVSMPLFLATGNPDRVSGTFGNNAYQFSVFLVIMGGFFLGKQLNNLKSIWYSIGIQAFIIGTFILLQFRAAMPAFFIAYILAGTQLYGRRVLRLGVVIGVLGGIAYYTFKKVGDDTDYNLKYSDFEQLADDPMVVLQYGKAQSYVALAQIYMDMPASILFGTGPGTLVSRANYMFTQEVSVDKDKGVGPIIRAIFGDVTYDSDVQHKYIDPMANLGILFGSTQVSNTNSSVVATLGETGIPGFVIIAMIYGTMLVRSRRYLKYARSINDPLLMSLGTALVAGTIYLLCLTPLDNYLEISRVTLPVWLLFWTVSTLHTRSVEQLEHEQLLKAYGEGGLPAVDPVGPVRPGARPGIRPGVRPVRRPGALPVSPRPPYQGPSQLPGPIGPRR